LLSGGWKAVCGIVSTGSLPASILGKRWPQRAATAGQQSRMKITYASSEPWKFQGTRWLSLAATIGKVSLETLSRSMVTLGIAIVLEMESFVRVKQAALMLGVSPNTVRAWGAGGKVPEYRHPVNNYRLYKLADLKKILRRLEKTVSGLSKAERQSRVR
jgi:MerR family regulatory protein